MMNLKKNYQLTLKIEISFLFNTQFPSTIYIENFSLGTLNDKRDQTISINIAQINDSNL